MVIFNKHRCYNGGMGHLFEPIYDEKPTNIKLDSTDLYVASELKRVLQVRVYVCSVCKWCGKTTQRIEDEPK